MTSVNTSPGSPNSLNQLLQLKIDVVRYCLVNFGSNGKPKIDDEGFRKMVQRYEGSDEEYLRSMLKYLEEEKTALQKEETALQNEKAALQEERAALKEEKTALIISQAVVESKGPAPQRVDDFSAVWTAIVNHPIVQNQENPRLWSLHGGVKWIGGIQELYNRQCYDEITADISSMTHALVIGTPGIGKTLYLQVFLVHLFTRAKAEGRATPTIHYKYKDQKKVVTLSFLSDGSVVDVTDVWRYHPAPEYLLSDCVDLNHPYGTVFNFEVAASGNSRNYHEFEKRLGEPGCLRGTTIIMPVWSFDELTCIRPDTMDLKIAQFRYGVYGGSARNFMFLKNVRSRVLPVVEDTMNLFQDFKINYPDEWSNIARHLSAQLASEDPSICSSLLRHVHPGGTRFWATRFILILAGAIYEDRSDDVAVVLRQFIVDRSHVPFTR